MTAQPRIAVVLGTRAQMVKMAPVMQAMQTAGIAYWFLHTGQHRETFDDLRQEFGVKQPDQEAVATTDDAKSLVRFGGWGAAAVWALTARRRRLIPFCSGIVMVHGDTASTVWGALLGRLTGNRVFHIESGLRSYNVFSPFPEELARLATFYLASIYGCPGQWAIDNLRSFRGTKLNLGANTLYDAYRTAQKLPVDLPFAAPHQDFALFSIHRFETLYHKQRLDKVVQWIEHAGQTHTVLVVRHSALLHRLKHYGLHERLEHNPAIQLIPRMGYAAFIQLLQRAAYVVTDGGSNQEELYYMGKPTLVLREATERQEGLGRNVVRMSLRDAQLDEFFAHYREYAYPGIELDISPSQVIVEWLSAID